MLNKRGGAIIELLLVLVVVVITSAVVLLLVSTGVVSVKGQADAQDVPLLNTEFIPLGQESYLAIQDFQFCESVTDQYNCINTRTSFNLGSEVHFKFTVESSSKNGDIIIVENYRIKGPSGELLLDVEAENDFYFNARTRKPTESISFKDYFFIGSPLLPGIYTLELVLENPLIGKKTTVVKSFALV